VSYKSRNHLIHLWVYPNLKTQNAQGLFIYQNGTNVKYPSKQNEMYQFKFTNGTTFKINNQLLQKDKKLTFIAQIIRNEKQSAPIQKIIANYSGVGEKVSSWKDLIETNNYCDNNNSNQKLKWTFDKYQQTLWVRLECNDSSFKIIS
jgi:hypothetical protein